MKSIRDYINLVTETDLIAEKVTLPADPSQPVQTQTVNGVTMNAPANAVQTGSGGTLKTSDGRAVTSGTPAPDANAAAAAKAKLTPSQLKWLGGADATDPHIMARMPKPLPGEKAPGAAQIGGALNPGIAPTGPNGQPMKPVPMDEPAGQAAQPAADPNAPLATPPGAEPDAAPQAAATGLAEPTDADVAAAGAPAGAPGAQDDATGVDAAVAAQAAAPSGQAAQPANRDAMPFGKAFADAKAKGEKEFTWKGKKYAVQMAKPKPAGQAAQPAKPGFTTGIAPKVSLPGASQSQNDALSMMAAGNMGAESVQRDNSKVLENNTTGYTELQRLISLINHR